tara:strand:+ start:11736 stop:12143 length:408 start_codon:yes stop_codon:yes gene_type:complete
MGFRCELCDCWLNVLQFSHLCPTCYKIRTITKCYNAETILNSLENKFLIEPETIEKQVEKDKVFQEQEEQRLEKEMEKQIESYKPKSLEHFDKCIMELQQERKLFNLELEKKKIIENKEENVSDNTRKKERKKSV